MAKIAGLLTKPEGKILEFKLDLSSPKPWLKTLVAFANSAGGFLLPGLTIEDMKQGASKIRNAVIARIFRELRLIEQWGTGVRRIFSEAQELGLPEPQIEEIGMRLRFIVPLKEPIQLKTTKDQVTDQVTDQVQEVVKILAGGELPTLQLMEKLGMTHRPTFRGNYLHPALEVEFIEMTIPEKPNRSATVLVLPQKKDRGT